MEKYNGNQKGFIYVSCDDANHQEVFDKYLEPLAKEGISFWWADSFDRKEEKNLERASAALVFLTNDYVKEAKLRDTITASVKNNKPVLCVYLEDVELDAALSMQTEAQQALFVNKYKGDDEFIEELKKAAIFDNIQITKKQKSIQRNRTLAAVAVAATVLVAAIVIVRPLLGSNEADSASAMGVLGLRGVSQEELESIEEIHIIGDKVMDYTVESTHYDENDKSKILYMDQNGEWMTTTPGNITDLSGMEQLKNLRVLEVEGQQIEDITPVLGLENLEELYLSCNPISSVDGVEKLGKLKKLDISSTNVTELPEGLDIAEIINHDAQTEIPDFHGEKDVIFRGNYSDFTDFSTLSEVENYEMLQFEADDYTEEILEELKGIPINECYIAGLQINSLEDLSGLDVRRVLDICHSSISSLDGIEHFEGITDLCVKGCENLTDLSQVNKLKSLKRLIIYDDMAYLTDSVDDRIEIEYAND